MKGPKPLFLLAITVGLALFGWFVWPTPWAYGVEYWESPMKPPGPRVLVHVRTNRFTGLKQNDACGGWSQCVW